MITEVGDTQLDLCSNIKLIIFLRHRIHQCAHPFKALPRRIQITCAFVERAHFVGNKLEFVSDVHDRPVDGMHGSRRTEVCGKLSCGREGWDRCISSLSICAA